MPLLRFRPPLLTSGPLFRPRTRRVKFLFRPRNFEFLVQTVGLPPCSDCLGTVLTPGRGPGWEGLSPSIGGVIPVLFSDGWWTQRTGQPAGTGPMVVLVVVGAAKQHHDIDLREVFGRCRPIPCNFESALPCHVILAWSEWKVLGQCKEGLKFLGQYVPLPCCYVEYFRFHRSCISLCCSTESIAYCYKRLWTVPTCSATMTNTTRKAPVSARGSRGRVVKAID